MFERAFETLRKNERDYKKTLRRYNFRKHRREASPSEQIGLISISNYEEKLLKDDLQLKQVPLHQKGPI